MSDRDAWKWLFGLLASAILIGAIVWMTTMHRNIESLQANQVTPLDWKVEGDKIVLAIRELEAHHGEHEAIVIEKLDAILEIVESIR